MALERLELDTAVAQGGVLTRSQLLEGGRTQKWIERETSAGRLIPLKNGVYRALDLRDHTDLLRAALVTLPNAVVSHESAAHLLRFPHLPALRPTVTVHSRTTHLFPGVTVRRTTDLESDHAIRVDGLKTTHTLRTCFDLAGVLDDATFEEVVEALAMADRLVVDDLVAFAASLRRRGKPGSSAIDRLVERRAGIDASKLERLGLRVLAAGGIPSPVLQYPAPWDDRERIDAAWPNALAGVEWDSKAWHMAASRMADDRRRDRQAGLAGWTILRYTWADLNEQPDRVVREVRQLLSTRL